MSARFGTIHGQAFDVVVIGGGMAGAGIARHAALRGYHTLLLERGKRTEHYRTMARAETPQLRGGDGYKEPRAGSREGTRAWEIEVRDALNGGGARITAQMVVNAASPWADRVRPLAGVDRGRPCVRTTKGIHLLLPHITNHAVYIAAKRDERMFFVIPWRTFSLAGTTDTDFEGDLDRVAATREEVQYLLTETQRVFPSARVREDEIAYTYAGVRPLAFEEGRAASAVSREHKVIPESEDETFLSITGTKLTCYRSLAEVAVNQAGRPLNRSVPCRTHGLALDGSDGDGTVEVPLLADAADLSADRSGS